MSHKLLKSVSVFGSLTFLSRIFGFIRDMIFAHIFGASGGMDAFLIAQKIPNLMRRLFAEGAFSQAFVPILSEYKTTGSSQAVRLFASRVAGDLGVIVLGVTLLGILCAPILIWIFAPGFSSGESVRFILASDLLRITFPYLFFISLTAFMGGLLNTYGIFSVSSFSPILLNIALIVSALFLSNYFEIPEYALAWGVLIGGVLQYAWHLPFVYGKRLLAWPRINFQDPGVRRILKLMIPALLGVSVNQINLLLDTLFASFLQVGSITWLYYADRLMEFPLGIFGVGLGTVILPSLATHYSAKAHLDFSGTLIWGIRWITLIGLPACLGLYLLAGPLICTLFQNGQFNAQDVYMSQIALMAYAPGVLGLMLVKVFASAFYARQDLKTPVKIAIRSMFCNVVLNVLLIVPLAHAGLALATALSALLNATLLFFGLKKQAVLHLDRQTHFFILRVFIATLAMGLCLKYSLPPLSAWLAFDLLARGLHLLGFVGLGVLIYLIILFISGFRVNHIMKQEHSHA